MVARLLAAGKHVRALVRDLEKARGMLVRAAGGGGGESVVGAAVGAVAVAAGVGVAGVAGVGVAGVAGVAVLVEGGRGCRGGSGSAGVGVRGRAVALGGNGREWAGMGGWMGLGARITSAGALP